MAAKLSRAVLRLGNMLVEGPRTIHRSNAIGNKYVESSTAFFWNCPTFSRFRSCRIYCDACGDENSGFLNPMVRFAYWERGEDARNLKPSWPNVVVYLSELPLDCSTLQLQIETLQRRIDTESFIHYGLPVRRNFGENVESGGGRLRIETSAGWQSINREFWISDDSDWMTMFDTIQHVVDAEGRAAVLPDWVERYDQFPAQLASSTTWEWDFKPIQIRPNSA